MIEDRFAVNKFSAAIIYKGCNEYRREFSVLKLSKIYSINFFAHITANFLILLSKEFPHGN